MTREVFWRIIDETRPKGAWAALHSGALEIYLEGIPEEEIVSFETHFRQLMAESYRWDLWASAYIINGGCSDDGFEYFRAWLISQGQNFYERCLGDTEAVGSRASHDQDNEDEEFMYCGREAYKEKTGREMPMIDVPRSAEPLGQAWREEDLPRLFPTLSKKFGQGG
jgi:Protein of unknown function (DUF4240)